MSGSDNGWPIKASGSIGNTLTVLSINPTRLGGYYIDNPGAAVAYIQFFDQSTIANVTLGTTSPDFSFAVPAGGAANIGIPDGVRFIRGMIIAVTTTRSGSTNPATTVDYNIWLG